jgi:hypothetical protein
MMLLIQILVQNLVLKEKQVYKLLSKAQLI